MMSWGRERASEAVTVEHGRFPSELARLQDPPMPAPADAEAAEQQALTYPHSTCGVLVAAKPQQATHSATRSAGRRCSNNHKWVSQIGATTSQWRAGPARSLVLEAGKGAAAAVATVTAVTLWRGMQSCAAAAAHPNMHA